VKTYEIANKLLEKGLLIGSDIQAIQVAMKLLGFMSNNYLPQCDGKWGKNTSKAIRTFNWEIFGREEDNTVSYQKISELLLDKNWFKIPFVENSDEENKKIVKYIDNQKEVIINEYKIPFDFLRAILWQETGLKHYDLDGFLFVGLDIEEDYKVKSRGWGLGQYTIKNHPPTIEQQKNIIEPLKNLEFVINHLKEKFKYFCKTNRVCIYLKDDIQYLRNCKYCIENSLRATIKLPQANYHPKVQQEGYKDIPMFNRCDWVLAIERYNGRGSNAIAYRYEVLCKILGREVR